MPIYKNSIGKFVIRVIAALIIANIAILVPPTQASIIKANISIYGISSSYNSGDTIGANVVVTNSGELSHFLVTFDIREPNGKWENLYARGLIIDQGESIENYFSYDIPLSGPDGIWTVRTEVYSSFREARYDNKEQTFRVGVLAKTTPNQTSLAPTALPAITPTATVTPIRWQENIPLYIVISAIAAVLGRIIYKLIFR